MMYATLTRLNDFKQAASARAAVNTIALPQMPSQKRDRPIDSAIHFKADLDDSFARSGIASNTHTIVAMRGGARRKDHHDARTARIAMTTDSLVTRPNIKISMRTIGPHTIHSMDMTTRVT